MKCENCGKREATFYYKSNINGRVTERHLCRDCAREQGYAGSFRPMRLWEDDFFAHPFGMLESVMNGLGARALTEFPMQEDIVRTAAAPQRQEELVSKEEREKLTQQRRRNALQAQLRDAVEREDFETAIRLRDEIRRLPQE